MKKRLKRYTSTPKNYPPLLMSGKTYLKYEQDDTTPQKGDVLFYLNAENTRPMRGGEYHATGQAGYLRAEVFDGRRWQILSLAEFFPHKENYFSKTQRPIDTYMLCADLLVRHAGRNLRRTYREHYTLMEEEALSGQ